MKNFFYLLIVGVLVGLVMYTCTSTEREAYDKVDKALDESQRYTDKVSGLAEQIGELCADEEMDRQELLDSINYLAGQIEYETNGAIDILDEAKGDLGREVYNNEY
jgi:hypothetical protein